jgi:hypothetical protein
MQIKPEVLTTLWQLPQKNTAIAQNKKRVAPSWNYPPLIDVALNYAFTPVRSKETSLFKTSTKPESAWNTIF